PMRFHRKLLLCCIVFSVGLSLAREVAEIWIYLGGFLHQPDVLQSALTGSAIGIGIGISLGIIIYYFLVFISERLFLYVFLYFLLCGGLSMQVAKQLLQIGVLDSAGPLWDTSSLVNEHSWLGELLYALVGYDSSPAAIQVFFYWLAIAPLFVALLWNWYRRNYRHA
ncbi:MAG TPA: FTR1 family protein, partial [Cellvibrio sp.]